MICTEGDLYEKNLCNTECPISEVDEYIVVPDAELADKDYSDFGQEQEPENVAFLTPETAGEDENNCTDNNEICDLAMNKSENNDSSYNAEPVQEDPIEPPEIIVVDSLEEEKENSSKARSDCEIDPSEAEMNCADKVDDAFRGLDLVKDNNEYDMGHMILNGEEVSKDTIYEDIIGMHLEPAPPTSDDLPPICEDPGEEVLPHTLEKGQSSGDADLCETHDRGGESDLNIERERAEDVCAHPDTLADDAGEAEIGLDLNGCETETAESTDEGAVEKADICPDAVCEQNENRSDGYQATVVQNEEKTSEAVHDTRENSTEQNGGAIQAEAGDDSCQIIPFEKEGSEDVPDSPEDLGECLALEEAEISNANPPFILQEANEQELKPWLAKEPVPEVLLGDCSKSEHTLEDSESESQMAKVDHSNSEEMATDSPSAAPSEDMVCSTEELDKHNNSKAETNLGREYEADKTSVVPEVVVVNDEDDVNASDSLDDPYVLGDSLPLANETYCAAREAGKADLQCTSSDFRDGMNMDSENHLLPIDRKNIVTRTRSLSGKVPGYVPETVPEETGPDSELQPSSTSSTMAEDVSHSFPSLEGKHMDLNRALPAKPRHFVLYPRSCSVEGRDIPVSGYRETDTSVLDYNRMNRTEGLSLPCVIGSSGSFSQQNHLPSSGLSTPSSVVDIPPPFELACITKKPIAKSSPSLLIESECPDKYCKKKKSSFKKFLTLKFMRKSENKVHVDVHVSSSRSCSESSSYQGPSRLMELDRRSLSGSPQLKSRTGKLRASESPTVLFYKDGKRKGTPKTFSRSVSRVESFEDRSRPPFMPLPLTKPRSISFPNADTSDYENIPAINSDYENIQIPPRRPNRAGTFTEFFEDPTRALSAANENDGYVDMSSFTAFENNKPQSTNQETERYCNTYLCKAG